VEYQVILVRINELQPHEEARPKRVEEVAKSIARLGRVLKPVIVEERSLVIVDGHHRYHALRRLGARYVPVVLARYGRDIEAVKPPTKTIMVPAPTPTEALEKLVERLEELLDPGPSTLTLRVGNTTARLTGSIESIYRALGVLEREQAQGYPVTAIPEPLTPNNIVSLALKGQTYPPKSTLHITRLKKLYAPVKLSMLL